METTFFIFNKVITILNLDTQKIAPDFGDPPQKKIAKGLSWGTRAIFYSQWRCSFNKLLHCRHMRKFLCRMSWAGQCNIF